jgi:hypothetical protein
MVPLSGRSNLAGRPFKHAGRKSIRLSAGWSDLSLSEEDDLAHRDALGLEKNAQFIYSTVRKKVCYVFTPPFFNNLSSFLVCVLHKVVDCNMH